MISARSARPLRTRQATPPRQRHAHNMMRKSISNEMTRPLVALALNPSVAIRERMLGALGQSVLVHLMLAMTFVAFAALLYLAQASQASVLKFNISDLQAQSVQLDAKNASLQAAVNTLESPNRIDALSTRKLRMVRPNLTNTIWINPVVPRVNSDVPPAELAQPDKQSQPANQIDRFLQFVVSSL